MKSKKLLFVSVCSIIPVVLAQGYHKQVGNTYMITSNYEVPLQVIIDLPWTGNFIFGICPNETKEVFVNHEVRNIKLNKINKRFFSERRIDRIEFPRKSADRYASYDVMISPDGLLHLTQK
jgi:hypothetical protein